MMQFYCRRLNRVRGRCLNLLIAGPMFEPVACSNIGNQTSVRHSSATLWWLKSDVWTSSTSMCVPFKHPSSNTSDVWMFWWLSMVSEEGIFQVANVPMYWYEYTLPIRLEPGPGSFLDSKIILLRGVLRVKSVKFDIKMYSVKKFATSLL